MESKTNNRALIATLIGEMDGLARNMEDCVLRLENAQQLMEAILGDGESFKKPCSATSTKLDVDSFVNANGQMFHLHEVVEAAVPRKGFTGEDNNIGEIVGITSQRVKIDLGRTKPAVRAFDNIRKVEAKMGVPMDEGMGEGGMGDDHVKSD